jgi:hypothetical protein
MKENVDSFTRMIQIMNYDLSKTLIENEIKEQIIIKPSLSFDLFNWMKSWNTHDWLLLVQLILVLLGFLTGGTTALVAFLLAVGVDLTDAMLYLSEGDPYSAAMVAILAIVPANELLKLPGIKDIVQKRGVGGIKKLIKKNKSGQTLSPDEIKDLKFFGEKVIEEAEEITKLFSSAIKRLLLTYVSKKSTKWILNFLLIVRKTPAPIKIAGVAIPFDYLYMYVYRDDIKKMDLRNNSFVMKIINWVGEQIGWIEITPQMLHQETIQGINELDTSEFPSIPWNEGEPKINDTITNKYGK